MTLFRGWQGEALYEVIATDDGERWIVERRSRISERLTNTWCFDNVDDALAQVHFHREMDRDNYNDR